MIHIPTLQPCVCASIAPSDCFLSLLPISVELTGYWILPESLQEPPHPELISLLSTLNPSQPLFIGFGSMEAYLGDINWSSILEKFENGKVDS